MSELIFIDVGTHDGHTMEEVTKPKYKFDTIYGFEPMPEQFENVTRRFQFDHLFIFNKGLSDHSGQVPVYGDNANLGASIYAEKRDTDERIVTYCEMLEASEFVNSLPSDATVIMKLNCEGAEIPILNNLIDTGAIHRLANVMIDFDIRKVSGREQEEQKILDRMATDGFARYSLCDHVMHGPTHQDRIANWLISTGIDVFK